MGDERPQTRDGLVESVRFHPRLGRAGEKCAKIAAPEIIPARRQRRIGGANGIGARRRRITEIAGDIAIEGCKIDRRLLGDETEFNAGLPLDFGGKTRVLDRNINRRRCKFDHHDDEERKYAIGAFEPAHSGQSSIRSPGERRADIANGENSQRFEAWSTLWISEKRRRILAQFKIAAVPRQQPRRERSMVQFHCADPSKKAAATQLFHYQIWRGAGPQTGNGL
jgi:hypothetical protein